MHTKCTGDILVYMDDDDYYPPKRVSHAVSRLMSQPKAVAAGSSVVFIYFNDLEKVFQFGPYGHSHATAGTFAFKKELLKITRYNDNAEMAEEKEFLKNYTIPFVQLDPRHAILVFAHQYNTFDKRKLLVNPNPRFVRQTNLSPANFIKNKDILKFYLSVSIKK
jgi:hypothetical protein